MTTKRKKTRGNPAKAARTEQTAVWMRTEPTLDGTGYMVVIEIDDDHALTLDREQANAYSYAILEAVARAEYDAAVFNQISKRMSDKEGYASQLVVDLRKDRPDIDFSVMEPMSFTPGVNQRGKPFLLINMAGEPVGQWDLKDARLHALMVLESIVVADLDAGYRRALLGIIGLEGHVATSVVDDLRNYRTRVTL